MVKSGFWILVFMLLSPSVGAQDFCAQIINHKPADDVTYNPNEADVPADLNAIRNAVPDENTILIELDVLEFLGINDFRGIDMMTEFAKLTIKSNGEVFYNNQDITKNISDHCSTISSQQADGQSVPNPIISGTNNDAPKAEDVLEGAAN